ncbi:flagellar basal body-associated FliL family protein [Undibacterium pigrum]|uniref:Flagellar protein FliL n=1 Tax=Undibacterium pigrum TaxID=401470 RepID=A0A318IW01_9BURK|nr:flagellar basal body-associated FliL family protein [Undibacterium pigrum]PXX40386.1 flagellar basal body-associated protein FliL [Undibacterium pigrum]
MSKDRSKASILSAQLDFEAIDGSAPKPVPVPDDDVQEAKPAPKAVPIRSAPPVQTPKKPALERKPVKKKNNAGDRFGAYAAAIVLVGFAIMLAIFFYIRSVNSNAAGLSYFVLPQQVANLNGQVVRMQVTIQVRTEDSDWLYENKKLLTNLFQIEFAKIDPDDLHSEEGFDTVRSQLKTGLNQSLQTDKIESVLINELLVQNRE